MCIAWLLQSYFARLLVYYVWEDECAFPFTLANLDVAIKTPFQFLQVWLLKAFTLFVTQEAPKGRCCSRGGAPRNRSVWMCVCVCACVCCAVLCMWGWGCRCVGVGACAWVCGCVHLGKDLGADLWINGSKDECA